MTSVEGRSVPERSRKDAKAAKPRDFFRLSPIMLVPFRHSERSRKDAKAAKPRDFFRLSPIVLVPFRHSERSRKDAKAAKPRDFFRLSPIVLVPFRHSERSRKDAKAAKPRDFFRLSPIMYVPEEMNRQDSKAAKPRGSFRLSRTPGRVREMARDTFQTCSAWRCLRLGGSSQGPAVLLLVTLLLMTACGGGDATTTDQATTITPPKDAIAETTENGPVKATIKVWPAKPTLGETIYARLEIDAPVGVSINAPFQEAGDQRLGRFRVVGFVRDTERKPDGGQLQHQTYTLEAPSSGRHRIPPLRLEMIDARAGSPSEANKPQELLTDEVPLEIAPVPAEQASAQLKPALGELDPDVGKTSWLLILGLVSLAAMIVSGSLLAVSAMRARRRIEKQRSAYDEAVAHLRELEHRGAPDETGADAWFVELSSIVRRYLEHRYDIRAPELTTEEFLLVATARPELTEENRGLLTSFLERCDRVKFAGYRPDAAESMATLAAARGFVEDTRLREHLPKAVAA
jgi:hypothetical protein